jgi:hypothetical protein
VVVEGAKLPVTGTARALLAEDDAVCADADREKAKRLIRQTSPRPNFFRFIENPFIGLELDNLGFGVAREMQPALLSIAAKIES